MPSNSASLLDLYRMMVRVRAFEEQTGRLYLWGKTNGPVHLSTGQEAVAAGFGAAMDAADLTYATYRGHGHALARGLELTPAFAEMMGRAGGQMSGKGGSMHLIDPSKGMMGCNAIIGAHLTMAAGSAWAASVRGTGQVVTAYFGDGTTNIGAFHEALNLAAVWRLPVVFVCENNLYSEYTLTSTTTPVAHPAADRAASYGLERILVDGNDAEAVHQLAGEVYARVRGGGGPALVEALTYRHTGHAAADPAKYRPEGELAEWKAKDPLVVARARLLDRGTFSEELDTLEQDLRATVKQASDEAEAQPAADLSKMTADVWADGGAAWCN